MRLTPRGVAVLVVSVVLVATAEWAGYPLFRVLGAIGLGALPAAVAVTARGMRVAVTRVVYPDRVERGRPALAKLRVRNLAGRPQAGFAAWDHAGGSTRTVQVRALAEGAEATYQYELPTAARGLMAVGPLTLQRADPFGLARNRHPAGETGTLWVHPRKYPARALIGGFPRHHHDGATTDDSLRGSLDLRDVREYQPGDEVRHLHWKATARTGRMMVRDYADPEQPRFTLLLDTRGDALSPALFEEAVDLAASLLAASATAGHHSRLVTSGGVDLATSGGLLAVRQLLDELCQVRQDSGAEQALVPGVLSAVRHQGGCLTVVTSGAGGLGTLGGLAGLRARYSSFFVLALGSGGVPPVIPGARVLSADSAANAVRRWNEVV
ncbi:DUF58 domain-containing protein [Amycolatopsis sp. NPDC051045]|uniref:DUF58 domain-containing protein n=1 Tax=Amycolatopsis sp. NPDC051045 TaxID=3156922 RepID=UPI00341526FB